MTPLDYMSRSARTRLATALRSGEFKQSQNEEYLDGPAGYTNPTACCFGGVIYNLARAIQKGPECEWIPGWFGPNLMQVMGIEDAASLDILVPYIRAINQTMTFEQIADLLESP